MLPKGVPRVAPITVIPGRRCNKNGIKIHTMAHSNQLYKILSIYIYMYSIAKGLTLASTLYSNCNIICSYRKTVSAHISKQQKGTQVSLESGKTSAILWRYTHYMRAMTMFHLSGKWNVIFDQQSDAR